MRATFAEGEHTVQSMTGGGREQFDKDELKKRIYGRLAFHALSKYFGLFEDEKEWKYLITCRNGEISGVTQILD